MIKELIMAMLVATAPEHEPENVAAFFTEQGPELCALMAEAMNNANTDTLFVCEVNHG